MNKLFFAFLSLCFVALLNAQENDFSEFPPDREFVYKSIDGIDLKLYVYAPEGHDLQEPKPVIVLFFGGGWVGGKASQLSAQCDFFARQGMVAITADYRVKGRHKTTPKECVKDGKSAIRWIRSHAKELGIDPNQLIAGGASAGGHVAAAAGTGVAIDESTDDLSVSARPNALVLFNPVFDNGPGGYGHERVSEYWETISPMHNIDAQTPPTIVFFGDKDQHVPVETPKEYQQAMEAVGGRCDVFIYPGKGHGFFNYRAGGDADKNKFFYETMQESATFLKSLGVL